MTTNGSPTPSLSVTSGTLPSGRHVHGQRQRDGRAARDARSGTGGSTRSCSRRRTRTGRRTQSFTLTVDEAPSITSTNSADFVVNQASSFTVTTGGYPASVDHDQRRQRTPFGYHVLRTTATGRGRSPVRQARPIRTLSTSWHPTASARPPVKPLVSSSAKRLRSRTRRRSRSPRAPRGASPSQRAAIRPRRGRPPTRSRTASRSHRTARFRARRPRAASSRSRSPLRTGSRRTRRRTSSSTSTARRRSACRRTETPIVGVSVTLHDHHRRLSVRDRLHHVCRVHFPPGLSFNPPTCNGTATVTGTPTQTGSWTANFYATDSYGSSSTETMTFNVESVPNVTAPSTETFTAGTAASFSVSTSGVPSPSVSRVGLACRGCRAAAAVVPAHRRPPARYTVTFTASNAAGSSQPASTTVTVNSPPPPPPPKASIRLGATTAEVTENVAEVKATCDNANVQRLDKSRSWLRPHRTGQLQPLRRHGERYESPSPRRGSRCSPASQTTVSEPRRPSP